MLSSRGRFSGIWFFLFLTFLTQPAFPGDRQADYMDLRLMIGREQFGAAFERCKSLIAAYPDYVYLYETLAELGLYSHDLDGAARYFEERIDDGTGLAMAYFGLGTVYFHQKAYREAALCFDKAIELGISVPECYRNFVYAYERLEGVDASIRFFNSLCHRDPRNPHLWYAVALAYWSKHDYPTVLRSLDEALSRNPVEQKYLQAKAAVLVVSGSERRGQQLVDELSPIAATNGDLNGLQFLRSYSILQLDRQSDSSSVEELAEASLRDARRYGLFRWIGWCHERLANLNYAKSDFPSAIRHSQMAFAASRRCSDTGLALDAIIRQLESSMDLGKYMDALECAYSEFDLSQTDKDNVGLARALCDLAWIFHEVGLHEVALEHSIEALGMLETSNASNELLTRVYAMLGLIYGALGNAHSSLVNLEFSDALIPKGKVWDPHRAVSHGNIGRAYLQSGNLDKAFAHFSKGLELSRLTHFRHEEVFALINLGDFFMVRRKFRTASKFYQQSYELSKLTGQVPGLLASARGLAAVYNTMGAKLVAVKWYDRAFALAEQIGLTPGMTFFGMSPKSRLRKDYEEYIALLSEIGREAEAFSFAERVKALSVVSPFFRAVQNERPVTLVEDRPNQWKSPNLPATWTWTPRSLRRDPVVSVNTVRQLVMASLKSAERRRVEIESKASSLWIPNVRMQNLDEMRARCLHTHQALVEYIIGADAFLIFVLTKDSFRVIQQHVSRDSLASILMRVANVFGNRRSAEAIWSPTLAGFDARGCQQAYDCLLKPVVAVCPWVSELLIVPDDILIGFPFETTIVDDSKSTCFSESNFLIQKYKVSYAVAASGFPLNNRQNTLSSDAVVGIANADYDRLVPDRSIISHSQGADDNPRRIIRHLKGAEDEVGAISQVFGTSAEIFVGRDATKSLLKAVARKCAIIHIAAHSSFDYSMPTCSSVFLAPDSETGDSGVLHSFEISDLDIDANLVVLSSCDMIRNPKGQGFDGFARDLTTWGAGSVITTLWSVDDRSTSYLMQRFYNYLSEGISKSAALQSAKLDLIRSGKKDPFYWAPFILIGNSEPLPSPIIKRAKTSANLGILIVLGLAAVGVFLIGCVIRREIIRSHKGRTESAFGQS